MFVCVAAAICIVHYRCRKTPPRLTLGCLAFCGASPCAGTTSDERCRSRSQDNVDPPNIPSSGRDRRVPILGKAYVYYRVFGVPKVLRHR